MHQWQLTPDGLRELDLESRRVRRLEGIRLPTEREGRDGSWRSYLRLVEPMRVGEPVEIVWPSTGRSEPTPRSTTTTPTIAVMDDAPDGPWGWGYGDEAGVAGLVSLDGHVAAHTLAVDIAFVLAHLCNGAEVLADHPAGPDVVTTVRVGEEGHRAVLVGGSSVCVLPPGSGARVPLVARLSRWAAHPEVIAALKVAVRDLGAWEMIPVWDLPDPADARQALVAGGLSAASTARLDAVGSESYRPVARLAGRFGDVVRWSDAVGLVEAAPAGGGPSVVDLVAAGDVDRAASLTDELVERARGTAD